MNALAKLILCIVIVIIIGAVIYFAFNSVTTNLFSNPINESYAYGIRRQADVNAEISQWYANQRINESNAILFQQQIQAAQNRTDMPYVALIVVVMMIFIVWLVSGAFRTQNVERNITRNLASNQWHTVRNFATGDMVMLDGVVYEICYDHSGAYLLEVDRESYFTE